MQAVAVSDNSGSQKAPRATAWAISKGGPEGGKWVSLLLSPPFKAQSFSCVTSSHWLRDGSYAVQG